MTYQSAALAMPNLLALWMLNDSAGSSTAADLGPNNLPLTYSASKVNGVENISGAGAGMLSGTGGVYASRAVASGSTLAPTAAITVAAWITPTAFLTPTGGSAIAGRNNHFRLRCGPDGQLGLQGWTETADDARISAGWAATTNAYFIVGVYTGIAYRVYVNGVLLQENLKVSALAAVADDFVAGATSTPMDGTISGVGVWSRALTDGEIRTLFEEGTKVTPVTQGVATDNLYDPTTSLISGAAQDTNCAYCSGKRRVNEPAIIRGTAKAHPSCYVVRATAKTTVVPASGTAWADYEGAIVRAIRLMLEVQTRRVTSMTGKGTYFDGTRMNPTTGLTGGNDVYGPWAMTAALLLHHGHVSKADKSWMIPFVISQVERIWSLQTDEGNIVEDAVDRGGDFIMPPLAETYLIMRKWLSAATAQTWKRNLLKLGKYYVNYPLGAPENTYPTNGNREYAELLSYWMQYLVHETEDWNDYFEDQYTFLHTSHVGAADPDGVNTYNFIEVTAPTQPDGSDGAGFFVERSGSRVGTLTGPGATVLSGFDVNYSDLCSRFGSYLYCYNQDPRILKDINMVYNLITPYANMTSSTVGDVPAWTLDGRGGSRQNNLATFGTATIPVLKNLGGRSITGAHQAGAVNEAIRFFTVDQITSINLSRDLNLNLGVMLRALPSFPELV